MLFQRSLQGKTLYDLTEFVSSPHRTGIQRVTLEIARHWPRREQLVPTLFRAQQGFLQLPNGVWNAMERYFSADSEDIQSAEAELRSMADSCRKTLSDADLDSCDAILCAEVFYCPERVEFYQGLLERHATKVFVLLHDLFPWFHPEYFPHVGSMLNCMPYLRLVRQVQRPLFTSEAVRRDYLERLRRNTEHDGIVTGLGADSISSGAPSDELNPARFCVVGTIEPRKNHAAALAAFQSLWADGVQAELLFVGRAGWCDDDFIRDLQHLEKSEPRFHWISKADDELVAEIVRGSRASIFPSLAEGFGIPPLESLALGTPVIATAHIPSIQMLAPEGQIRLETPNPAEIRAAVESMLDDTFARNKKDEIRRLALPTWRTSVKRISEAIKANCEFRLPAKAA